MEETSLRIRILKILFFVGLFVSIFVVSASAHSSEVIVDNSSLSLLVKHDTLLSPVYDLKNTSSGFNGTMILPADTVLSIRSGFEFTVTQSGMYWLSSNFLSECAFDASVYIYDPRDSQHPIVTVSHGQWQSADDMSFKSAFVHLEAGITYRLWAVAADKVDLESDMTNLLMNQIFMDYSITLDTPSDLPIEEPSGSAPADVAGYLQLRSVDESGKMTFRYFGLHNLSYKTFNNEGGATFSPSISGSKDVLMATWQSSSTGTSSSYAAVCSADYDLHLLPAPITGNYSYGIIGNASVANRSDGSLSFVNIGVTNLPAAEGTFTSTVGTQVDGKGINVKIPIKLNFFTLANNAIDISAIRERFLIQFRKATAGSAVAYMYVECVPQSFIDVTNNYFINEGDTYNYNSTTYITNNTTINNITYEGDTIINNNGGGENPGGGGGDGWNFWEWLADRLGTVFDTLIDVIGRIVTKVISALIDWILDLVDALLDFLARTFAWFDNIFTAPSDFFDAIDENSGLWDFYRQAA